MRTDIKLNTKNAAIIAVTTTAVAILGFTIWNRKKQEEVVETAQPTKLPFKVEVLHSATEEQITALFAEDMRKPYTVNDIWATTGKETTVTEVAKNEYFVDSEMIEKAVNAMNDEQRLRFFASFYSVKVAQSPKWLFAIGTNTPIVFTTDLKYTIVVIPTL